MPSRPRRSLEQPPHAEHQRIIARAPDDLHADGQAFAAQARGHARRRQVEDVERLRVAEGAEDADLFAAREDLARAVLERRDGADRSAPARPQLSQRSQGAARGAAK